jgi:Tol biopolymer transport system component
MLGPAEWGPEGATVAAGGYEYFLAGGRRALPSAILDATKPNFSSVGFLHYSPDGQFIHYSTDKTGVMQVNRRTGDEVQLAKPPGKSAQPTVSPDGQTIAYVSLREKNYDIWLMGRDGSNQRRFTVSPQQREWEPHFLHDGTLAYLMERREGNRTVQQVVKADLSTGSVTALTGIDLAIASFAVSPAGDVVALVVNAEPQNKRNPAYKVYIQAVNSGMPVPMPTTGTEQMITPTFRP